MLEIDYTGTINNNMAGFYRSKYKPVVEPSKIVPMDGGSHCMFSTQFESCDARRAFPCFDEPNLKASFDFSIEIPSDLVALSNMPEKETVAGKKGLKVVTFERTPVMSTYVSQLESASTSSSRSYLKQPNHCSGLMTVTCACFRGTRDSVLRLYQSAAKSFL